MKYSLKSGTTINVSATRTIDIAPWRPSGLGYWVEIRTNGHRAAFKFWDSHYAMTNNKPVDLRGALGCFASDALAGQSASDLGDIMEEFGYTEVKEARRVFAGVKRAEAQAARLGLTWDDLAELADY